VARKGERGLRARASVPGTRVSRYFDEHDKVRFVEEWCAQNGYSMSQVAAIGDSRSDVPLFRRVGMSIALNATTDARAVATHVIDTPDLRDVLALLQLGEAVIR
jgi:phosphoserine phosphatase